MVATTIEEIYRTARAHGYIWDYAHRAVLAAEDTAAAMRYYLRQSGVYIPEHLRG